MHIQEYTGSETNLQVCDFCHAIMIAKPLHSNGNWHNEHNISNMAQMHSSPLCIAVLHNTCSWKVLHASGLTMLT